MKKFFGEAYSANTEGTRRYHELDSLRGIASLTVFFSHFSFSNVFAGLEFERISKSPLHLLWDGESAVLFFFVLSGFVLALPYVKTERPIELAGFYNKRILRIYPAFIGAILLCLIFKYALYNPENTGHYSNWLKGIWQWDFKDNWKHIIKTPFLLVFDFNTNLLNPPIWSLQFEMKISILLPFLIICIKKNTFVFNALFIIALVYLNMDFYVAVFYFGVLLASYHEIAGAYLKRLPKVAVVFFFIVAALLYSCRYALGIGDDPGTTSRLHLYISVAGSCIFIIMAIHQPGISRFLKNRVCQFLGKISYSFYLIHLPILIVTASLLPFTNNYSVIIWMLASLSLSWLLSLAMYRFIEMPFQQLAHWMVKRFAIFRRIRLQ